MPGRSDTGWVCVVKAALGPERDVNQRYERGDLYEGANDSGERFAGGYAERSNRHGDGQLEVVAGRGECER